MRAVRRRRPVQGRPRSRVRVPRCSRPIPELPEGHLQGRSAARSAALSINTSYVSPYDDEQTDVGFLYAYRAGSIDQPDNRALRAACELQVPLVYFIGTRPGWYRPGFPSYIIADDPVARRVTVGIGQMAGPLDRLKETRLLDAAHIIGDLEEHGAANVSNGLSLCSIHLEPSIRISSACRPTTRSGSRDGSSKTTMGRCWIFSKASIDRRSTSRSDELTGRIRHGSLHASTDSRRRLHEPEEQLMTDTRTIDLTDAEIHLLREALDSHEYWQLSETHQRNDGHSTVEDGANAEIDAIRALETKLWQMTETAPGDQAAA